MNFLLSWNLSAQPVPPVSIFRIAVLKAASIGRVGRRAPHCGVLLIKSGTWTPVLKSYRALSVLEFGWGVVSPRDLGTEMETERPPLSCLLLLLQPSLILRLCCSALLPDSFLSCKELPPRPASVLSESDILPSTSWPAYPLAVVQYGLVSRRLLGCRQQTCIRLHREELTPGSR